MTKLIKQDNSITNARYEYSSCQQDLIFMIMGQIHDDDTTGKQYKIVASELDRLTGRKWNYQQLKEATEGILRKVYQIETETTFTQFVVFQQFEYVKGTGIINVRFNDTGLMLYKNLKGNFTTYELHSAISMSSKYAKRIYQICSQWKDVGESKKFDIVELKKNLGLINESEKIEEYEKISQFKERVLDVAVKQINKHTDLQVSYHMEGEYGKKKPLKYITFYIKRKSPLMLPIEFQDANLDARKVNVQVILQELGIKATKIVNQILANEDMIKEVFSFHFQMKTDKIKVSKNAGGLLLKKLGLV